MAEREFRSYVSACIQSLEWLKSSWSGTKSIGRGGFALKKPKTRGLVKSLKSINKKVRILRRGIVRGKKIVRHKEWEQSRSSAEQIQKRNDARMQQDVVGTVCVSVIATTAIRKRWLRAVPTDPSYLPTDENFQTRAPINSQRLPAKGKQMQFVRRQSVRLTGKTDVQRLPERSRAEKGGLNILRTETRLTSVEKANGTRRGEGLPFRGSLLLRSR